MIALYPPLIILVMEQGRLQYLLSWIFQLILRSFSSYLTSFKINFCQKIKLTISLQKRNSWCWMLVSRNTLPLHVSEKGSFPILRQSRISKQMICTYNIPGKVY